MNYLRNSWYCAGWSSEITGRPLGRTMLDEYLVLYRRADGQPVAMSGRCPHRFAPLARGEVVEDGIQCPYHGLRFGSDGRCVLNPHGDGVIPPRAALISYPIVERNAAVWIWMGDPGRADESMLPQHSFLSDPTYSTNTCYLKVQANYQLVIDNLLDLTHAQYLHGKTLSSPNRDGRLEYNFRTEGHRVHSDYFRPSVPPNPLMGTLFGHPTGDQMSKMTWMPASILDLDLSMRPVGGNADGLHMPSAHYVVPETEITTHYFAAISRNARINDRSEDDRIISIVRRAFVEEDEPMIRACQELMGTSDLLALRPVVLKTDTASLQARRILDSLIREGSSDR